MVVLILPSTSPMYVRRRNLRSSVFRVEKVFQVDSAGNVDSGPCV